MRRASDRGIAYRPPALLIRMSSVLRDETRAWMDWASQTSRVLVVILGDCRWDSLDAERVVAMTRMLG